METAWHRIAGALLVMVSGCGYPVDIEKWLPDIGVEGDHGAIALDAANMNGALTARFPSQQEADAKALRLCGEGCEIVLRFEGKNACGALASAPNGRYGVADGDVKAETEAAAIQQCQAVGGNDCVVELSACNS
jgi:hypothetical protein